MTLNYRFLTDGLDLNQKLLIAMSTEYMLLTLHKAVEKLETGRVEAPFG